MAAPMVSGGVALLLEQFKTLFDLNLDLNAPLPALIRGLLIHTARAFPSFSSLPSILVGAFHSLAELLLFSFLFP